VPGKAEVALVDVEIKTVVLAALVGDRERFGLAPIPGLWGTVGSPVGSEIGSALGRRRLPPSLPGSSWSGHASLCRPMAILQADWSWRATKKKRAPARHGFDGGGIRVEPGRVGAGQAYFRRPDWHPVRES